MIKQKKCSTCHQMKLTNEFYRNKTKKDGFTHQCKECGNKHKREYYLKNREMLIEKKKQYNLQNKEKIKKNSSIYYIENKAKIRKKQKEYYNKNKESLLKKKKIHYNKNREEILEKKRKHFQENKEELIKKKDEYHKKIEEKYGLDVKYGSLHQYIKLNKLKLEYCIICNENKKIDLASIGHTYTRNPNDYIFLCRECHRLFDKTMREVEE